MFGIWRSSWARLAWLLHTRLAWLLHNGVLVTNPLPEGTKEQ